MAASWDEISNWFDEGLRHKHAPTHMIVVCDNYDHENYPVYVRPTEDVCEICKMYNSKNMQRVIEVYNLSKNKECQMKNPRVMNLQLNRNKNRIEISPIFCLAIELKHDCTC